MFFVKRDTEMSQSIFISGNGTDVGKTVVSACLVHALKADYWKPVQAGDVDFGDSDRIQKMAGESVGDIHPSTYKLTEPMSPHAAAAIDGVDISLTDFRVPQTENNLIIEGAGGLLVPINENETIVDLISHLGAQLVLVCANYLGSINHSLLSIQTAKKVGIPIKGLIFFGERNDESERIIQKMGGVKRLGGVYPTEKVTSSNIHNYSGQFKGLL